MNYNRVAVLIPVCNGAKTLQRSLESLVNQTWLNNSANQMCVFVSFNGCTDGSEDLVKSFVALDQLTSKPNVMFDLNMLPNGVKGIVPALNNCIFRALQEDFHFFARQDADDWWHPTKLDAQMKYMESHPEIDVLGTQIRLVSPETWVTLGVSKNPTTHERIAESLLQANNPIAHPSVLFKKRLFERAGIYDDVLPLCEDMVLWLKALRCGYKFANLETVGVDYTSTTNPNYTPLAPQMAAHNMKLIINQFGGK